MIFSDLFHDKFTLNTEPLLGFFFYCLFIGMGLQATEHPDGAVITAAVFLSGSILFLGISSAIVAYCYLIKPYYAYLDGLQGSITQEEVQKRILESEIMLTYWILSKDLSKTCNYTTTHGVEND